MDDTKEIDHEYTDNVVCPYCGYEMDGDVGDGPPRGEQQCGECKKYFNCEPDFSVYYTTTKLDCRNGSPHDWKHTPRHDYQGKECWQCQSCTLEEMRPGGSSEL